MDRVVRARFYQVRLVNERQTSFYDCLKALWEHPNRVTYQDLGGGTHVRIERWHESDGVHEVGFVAGEFVRQQTDNIPPVAEGGKPLRENLSPLGHRAAFRYHADTKMLLLETRQGAVSASRINTLIRRRLGDHKGFFLEPALSEDALTRLKEGTPRRATIKVARPSQMSLFEREGAGIEENLAALERAFDGPVIEVTASWPPGERDGKLSMGRLMKIFRAVEDNRTHFKKYTVKLAEEDQAIDMLAEQLKVENTLDLASDDVEANYQTRDRFLAEGFSVRLDEIIRVYRDR